MSTRTADRSSTATVAYRRLRSGAWGVAGPADIVREGESVTVSKRDASTKVEQVGTVVWTDGSTAIAAIASAGHRPASKTASSRRGSSGRGRCTECDRWGPAGETCNECWEGMHV